MAQEVTLLTEELQQLTQYMRDLRHTVVDTNEAFAKAYGKELGKNTAAVASNTTAVKANTSAQQQNVKLVDQYGKEIKSATKAQEDQTKTIEEAAKAQAALNEQKKREFEETKRMVSNRMRERGQASDLFREFGEGVNATSLLKNKFNSLGEGSVAANAGFRLLTAGAEGTYKAVTSMGAAIYKGERGLTVGAKALDEFVTPIADVVSGLGTLVSVLTWFTPAGRIFQGIKGFGTILKYGKFVGPALVGLGEGAKLATKYNKIAAEQTQTLYKSFQGLSQVGATAEGELGGVFNMLQTMGMSVSQIQEFNEMVAKSSKDLALMGGTVGNGLKRFADVTGELYKGDFGKELQEMGMNMAEQRTIAMEYMSIQARTGQLQVKNTAQLVKETAAFAKELDLSAKLTGESREEQAKKIRSAQMDERFRAAQREAELTNDQTALERLNRAAAVAAKFSAMGAEEEAKGIKHIAAYYAKTGQLAPGGSDEATKLFYTYGADAIRDAIEKGGIDGFASMVKAGSKMSDATLRLQSLLGRAGGGPLTGGVGQFESQQLINNIEKAMRETNFEGTIEEFVKTTRGKQVADDAMAKLMANTERTQQNTALTMDAGINTFNAAAELSNQASKAFDAAVQEFGRIAGVKVAGGLANTGGGGTSPYVPRDMLQETAVMSRDRANSMAEAAATAADIQSEAEKELANLKKIGAAKEEQAKAEQKIADAAKERERLEQEEIKAAREARQKELEARNARAAARRPGGMGGGAGRGVSGMPKAVGGAGVSVAGGDLGALTSSLGTGGMGGVGGAASDRKILDFIAQLESGGNYNMLVGGKTANLTDMTVAQVQDFQRNMISQGFSSTAVGKYQIIQNTLAGLVGSGAVGLNDKFDSATQDKLGKMLLERRGYNDYKSGKLSANRFADNLAMEWAGLPTGSGKSYYEGQNGNRALASREDFMKAISAQMGGIATGPSSGYPATLHGTEAIIPMPNGRSIPVEFKAGPSSGYRSSLLDERDMPFMGAGSNASAELKGLNESVNNSITQQVQAMGTQINKLDELVNLMRRQITTSEKILQVSQA